MDCEARRELRAAAAHTATEPRERTGDGTALNTPSWEPSHSKGSLSAAPRPAATSATFGKDRARCTARSGCSGCFQEVQGSVNAGGCREQRAGAGQAAGRPSHGQDGPGGSGSPSARLGWQRPAGLCSQHPCPAPPSPDCRAPTPGARHFLTPTCALRSLTAPEPMEMHQKVLSNELILVQSCYQSFCRSACHNLSCLVQPCPSPSPGCPTSPQSCPCPASPR